jgi:uncharacterized iron-regulated membrane protein
MSFRKAVFWLHLASGLLTGGVVAIMSFTGVAIAFEEELLAWRDRKVSHVASAATAPLSLETLRTRSLAGHPDFPVTNVVIHRDPARAYEFYAGREGPLYADPFTGELRESRAHGLHNFLHELEEWHRWLGFRGDNYTTGKAITGACNLAFVILCITGLYLWFPRTWSRRALRPRLWFSTTSNAKARDYTWHHVIGLWSLPVLLILGVTAVVISYGWAHRLVFTLAGEEAPQSRNFGMMATPPALVPPPAPDATHLPLDSIVARIAQQFPTWQNIGVPFSVENTSADASIKAYVTVPDLMPSRAYVPIELDPYTGEILKFTRFQDRSPGLQARVWIRFLHTGGAFGITGKIIATAASLAALVLVYTGFALSWRRFLRDQKKSS